jgi:hypothetical protein
VQSSLAGSFSVLFLPAFLGVLGGTAALALGLTWWFWRGDKRVKASLERNEQLVFTEPDNANEAFD